MRKYKRIRAASFDTHCLSYGNSGGRLESFKVVIEYDTKADKITSSFVTSDTKFIYKEPSPDIVSFEAFNAMSPSEIKERIEAELKRKGNMEHQYMLKGENND